MARRRSGVRLAARALPPTLPPFRPNEAITRETSSSVTLEPSSFSVVSRINWWAKTLESEERFGLPFSIADFFAFFAMPLA